MIKIIHKKNEHFPATKCTREENCIWTFLDDLAQFRCHQEALRELKQPEGECNLNMCCAERRGKYIAIIQYYVNQDYETLIPYAKCIDLIEQWKRALDQKYEEVIILADEDYNFTILADNRMVGGRKLKTF